MARGSIEHGSDFFGLPPRIQKTVLSGLSFEEKQMVRRYMFDGKKWDPEKADEFAELLNRIRSLGNQMLKPGDLVADNRRWIYRREYPEEHIEPVGNGKGEPTSNTFRGEIASKTPDVKTILPAESHNYRNKKTWEKLDFDWYTNDYIGGKPLLGFEDYPEELQMKDGFVRDGVNVLRRKRRPSFNTLPISLGKQKIGEMDLDAGILPEKVHRQAKLFELLMGDENDISFRVAPLVLRGNQNLILVTINQSEINILIKSAKTTEIENRIQLWLIRAENYLQRLFWDREGFLDELGIVRYRGDIKDTVFKRVRVSQRSFFRQLLTDES